MKRIHYASLTAALFCLMSFMAGDDTMTKENGVYIIDTTELGKDVEGYQATTPLKVYIKNNKVEKIEFQIFLPIFIKTSPPLLPTIIIIAETFTDFSPHRLEHIKRKSA